jgi:transposase
VQPAFAGLTQSGCLNLSSTDRSVPRSRRPADRIEIERCRQLTVAINEFEIEITEPVVTPTPALRAVVGVGVLTAAKIVGETAGAARFKSPAAFARHNGTAPPDAQNRTGPAPSRAGTRYPKHRVSARHVG